MPTMLTPGPLSMMPRGGSTPVSKKKELQASLEDLKNLLRRVTELK